jgi:hypothetical protein
MAVNGIELAVGQVWRTRGGDTVEVFYRDHADEKWPWLVGDWWFDANGCYYGQHYDRAPNQRSDLDLVELVSTTPAGDGAPAPVLQALPVVDAMKPEQRRGKQMMLPADPAARKGLPIATGVLDYFPLAIAEVARVSKAGNDQHNPGQPLHWDRTKSLDHADCIPRHLIDRGSVDSDGMRHSAKLAWRALALLQTELEQEQQEAA